MEQIFNQIDKMGESTPFMITIILIGIAITYLAISRARKEL